MLYILLCGYPPFYGSNDAQILERVKKGSYSFRGEAWGHISSEAKDLISNMLRMNPNERISAGECLNHPWIKNQAPNAQNVKLEVNIDNIIQFRKHEQLKKATLHFIASNLQESEIGNLKDVFLQMDQNKDGTLTM